MNVKTKRYIPDDNQELAGNSEKRSGWLVQVETTSRCNGKCVFCPYQTSWSKSHPGEMSDATYAKILADIAELGIKLDRFCPYFTNEPLLDPQILPRIRRAWDALHSAIIEISTNASMLTNDMALRMADTVEDINHEIWISFHGINRETYESIMELPYERTLANIINLLKLAESRKLKITIRGSGFSRYATAKHPYHFERADFLDFWNKIAADNHIKSSFDVKFIPYHDRAGNLKDKPYDYSVRRKTLRDFYCWRVDKAIHITWDGLVVICCNDIHREVPYGNVNERSLKNILADTPCATARKMAFGEIDSPPDFICKRCAWPGG